MASEAQRRYLRKKFAKEREEEKGCDCPGCDKCAGFVRNCTCDHDLTWLRMRHGETMDDKGSGENSRENVDMGETDPQRRERETGIPF
jgi:hypothetical protein